MTPDLSRLMDNLRIRCPGAIDDVLKLEIYWTFAEFLQDSNCWYEDVEFAVTPDVTTYYVTPTYAATAVRLLGVINSSNQGQFAGFSLPDEVTLAVAPSQNDTYTARLALTISDPVNRDGFPDYPDWVLAKYSIEIMDGVLGRMFTQVAKPYTNERMAIYHSRRFRTGVAQAKVEAQHQNVYRGQNWKFPQSFARRKAR